MDKFEYVVALVAVITGLGLSDVAVSLHRLLKRRSQVMWDWLPVALALYIGLALMRLWYQLWGVRAFPGVTDLPFVTVQIVQTLVLALAASAALPDEDDFNDGGIDLSQYYASHVRYIWTMYLAFELIWIATGIYFGWARGWARGAVVESVLYTVYFGVPLALTACALATARRWHGMIVGLLIAHELLFPSNFFGLLTRLLAAF